MAKQKFSKIISLVCALSLVLSIMIPLSMVSWAETEVSTTFTQQSIDVDFSQFDATLLTEAKNPFKYYYTSDGAYGGTCFSYDDGVLTYTRSASEPVFYNASGVANKNFLPAYETFPVSVTGTTSDVANLFKLTLNQLYRVKVTYKVDTITEGKEVALKASYTPKSGAADNVGTDASAYAVNLYTDPNLTNAKVVTATTDGYVTEDLYFMFEGDAFKYNTTTKNDVYLWLWIDASIKSNASNAGMELSMSFDSVKADAVSKVTFNAIDADTNEVTSVGLTYAGAPEESVSFAEAETRIQNLTDSTLEIIWYRDKDINDQVSSTETEVYTTTKEVAYYAWVRTTGGLTSDITVDFEDYQLRKYTGAGSGGASFDVTGYRTARFNIVASEDAHGGDKVMNYKVENYTYIQDQMYLYLGDGKAADGLDIEDKAIYKMTFYLKKDASVEATGDLKINFGNGGGLWSFMAYGNSFGLSNIVSNEFALASADLPEDWTQYTLYAYVDCASRNNQKSVTDEYLLAPSISVSTGDGKSVAVFMDDFTITKVAGGKNADSIIVEHIGSEKQYVSGTSGEAVTIPPLANTDTQIFGGWYTDSKYTTEYTATAFAAGITHIYAKYTDKTPTQPDDGDQDDTPASSVICDFETYTDDVLTNNNTFRADRFSISADAAYGDSGNGLKYHFVPTTQEGKDGTDAEPNTGYNKALSPSVKLIANGDGIAVKDQTWYKITFKYQVISSGSTVNVYPITSAKGNVWHNSGKAATEYTGYAFAIAANKAGKGWQEGEIIFQTDLTEASANYLFLWVGLDKKAEAQVYFDDVTVTETTAPVSDGSLKVEFDNYTNSITDKKLTFRNTVFAIDDTQSYSGAKSLRFFFDPNNEAIEADTDYNKMSNSAVLVDTSGKAIEVEDETTYEVTFYYNATNIKSDMNVSVLTTTYGNMWGTSTFDDGTKVNLYNWYSANGYTIPESHNGQGWKQARFYFKTDLIKDKDGNPADTLFIWVGCGSNVANELYIDSVSIKKLGPTDGVVAFVTNDTIGTTYQSGYVGDVINFPNLESYTQYTFYGWYADAEYTQKYTGTTIPAGVTNIYAKLVGSVGTSFEDYPIGWTTSKTAFRYDRFFLSKEDAYEGDTSIKFAYDPNNRMEDTQYNKERSCSFQLNNGSDTIKLTQNGYYKLTFWYKAVSGDAVTVIPYAGQKGNIWAGKPTQFTEASYKIGIDQQGKGWQQATIYLHAEMENPNCNTLFLWMAPNTDKATVCYIDKVVLTELYTDGMGIFLDYQNPNLNMGYMSGSIGEALTLPTPSVKGFEFTGWYTDAACTQPFTSTVFNKVGMYTIYAGWKLGKESYVDFEGTNVNVRPNRSQIGYINGSSAWEIDKTVNYEKNFAGIMLTPGDTPVETKEGQVFLVEVNYYVAAVPNGFAGDYFGDLYVQTSDKTNVWGNPSEASSRISLRAETGKWFTEKFFVRTAPLIEKANYLSLFITSLDEGFKLYIDNIKIVTVGDDEALVKFTTNMPADNGYQDTVIVPKGTVVTFPTPALTNYGFTGLWYTDAACLELHEGNTYKADESKEFFSQFYRKRYVQDFENEATNSVYDPLLCMYADTDHEISSADKHGGNYSMHRIGEYNDYQSFILFPGTSSMVDGVTYTITYWIKVESADHQLGAIRLADSQVQTWGWGRVGDIQYTVPFKDICDGEWHQVSYTFKAAGPRYALFTPGYASVYIDDIVVEATPDAEVSAKPEFEEYVAYRKDSLVQPIEEVFEIPESLFVKAGGGVLGGMPIWLIVVIAAAVVLIIGGGVTAAILIAKKKNQIKGGVK